MFMSAVRIKLLDLTVICAFQRSLCHPPPVPTYGEVGIPIFHSFS